MVNPSGMTVLTVDRHDLCFSVCCAIAAAHICYETCVRVRFTPGAGTERDSVFLVCADLTRVLKLDENTLVAFATTTK